ncbi:MAG: AtpZ/AtpI family protein [Lachnospiraceae bacterium]
MGKKNGLVRGLLMITQIGITMLAPIFLCLFVGLFLNEKLDTVYAVPILLLFGIAASFRNAYYLTKSFYAKEKQKEDAELAYIEELKRKGEEKRK